MGDSLPLVSVVVPAYNEAECLGRLHDELCRVCDGLPYRFEFLFVDDGSTDPTLEVLAQLRQKDPRVCFLGLARNFGHQAALSAGLEHAAGDAVIMMDGDLQHPPALLPMLLDRWQAGFDVVNTIRLQTEDIQAPKRLFSALFYKVFNWAANVRIEPGGADFRLMARPAVAALNALPERQRFLRGLVPWLGFRQTRVEFVAPRRFAGRSKLTFWRNLRFALDGITAFSFYPLRRAAMFGWLVALASCLYAGYALFAHAVGGDTVPGWTSLLLCTLFFGGCQLVLAGVLGEYLGRVLEQVKGRPLYLVRDASGVTAPSATVRGPVAGQTATPSPAQGSPHDQRQHAA